MLLLATLGKSQISVNSTEHFIMRMTQRQLVSNTEETETHIYIHTTIFEGTKHEEHLKIVKNSHSKRVHRKIVLDKSRRLNIICRYNSYRKVASSSTPRLVVRLS